MEPFPVTVRYRFGEGGGSREASFRGLLFDRSEAAVLRRLEEAHRFAEWVEVLEVRWRDGAAPAPALADRRGGRRHDFVSCSNRTWYAPGHTRTGCGRGSDMHDANDTRVDGAGERRGDAADAGWRPRRHARCSMFKPAHLVTDDAVLDCVLLDLSPGGAQVCLMVGAELPERAILWLPGGESQAMLRRWQRGPHVGFEAAGEPVPPS